ncbi:MAG: dihydroorotate dehydrogenase electron transfer subunit [Candidatus Kerfeldbacteria bacterium CG_4_10_14_0_8_um_filter_42_10]|uniref:Dihydroorotate dehydrogenase electron transfer subunit n=1 Tax=Candidatus Kerfeldbacteria bacterium CG_4_10_14_0_8_um_filter_42_10 TaxID=2014248 RepID=A0A2M7RLU6_9BACT|nr:MAG: dihydroorotate dehydrogenase electron transfer subunit [Candidatus Kerfeldbacteria bacterium CG_4_10_14_0_8_um_filter_42_10]
MLYCFIVKLLKSNRETIKQYNNKTIIGKVIKIMKSSINMNDWINKLDKSVMLKIVDRVKETSNVDTFYFDYRLNSRPGQFVMLWLPEINEKPFSIAYDTGEGFGLSIAKVGAFTEELFQKKKGERVGIRGPYGRPFWKEKDAKNVVMVGGGYGVAPLATLAEELAKEGVKVHFISGARSQDLLLFNERLKKLKVELYTTTNDGSYGTKGVVTDPLREILRQEKIDLVYCCGKEQMEKAVFDLCEEAKVNAQVSVERYMKCGIGVCGACSVDGTGAPTCQKGPVIESATLRKITEFGKYHRGGSGKKEYFK